MKIELSHNQISFALIMAGFILLIIVILLFVWIAFKKDGLTKFLLWGKSFMSEESGKGSDHRLTNVTCLLLLIFVAVAGVWFKKDIPSGVLAAIVAGMAVNRYGQVKQQQANNDACDPKLTLDNIKDIVNPPTQS